MKKITEAYFCDMCGKEIDINSDSPRRPIICSGYSSKDIPVHMHDSSYDEGYQDGISWESIDLCPECADRACAIQLDVYQDGGKWRSRLSWRGSLERQDEAEMSEGAKRIFDRMMAGVDGGKESG